MTVHSPLESLAAFAIAFMAGFATAIGLRLYVQAVKDEAAAMYRS